MDKQQATQHILNHLGAGYLPNEIAEELSRMLKAPPEVTQRFVDQVIASHPEAIQPSPAFIDEDIPDWMQPIVIEDAFEPETSPAKPRPNFTSGSDLPPGLQAIINESNIDAGFMEPEPMYSASQLSEPGFPSQAPFVAPARETENLEDEDPSPKIDLNILEEYVLGQLKKQRRHNDIIETVCQHTGWHWNKSQRFVARVKTKNHEKLQSGQNRVTIIIGIGIIVVGLVMTLNGASAIADYAKLASFARTNPEVLLNVSPQAIIFALTAIVTGIGMIVGGGYGVGRAMTNS